MVCYSSKTFFLTKKWYDVQSLISECLISIIAVHDGRNAQEETDILFRKSGEVFFRVFTQIGPTKERYN